MRYRLRTLLIVLAVGPMLIAGCWLVYRGEIDGSVDDILSAIAALSGLAFLIAIPFGLAYLAALISNAITRNR